ncbi:MAG: hypothetical protein IT561_05950 [Alphaproteobacteria bacterium]|nr:hypothetical protein [Alphaproteobacteria bacterium]
MPQPHTDQSPNQVEATHEDVIRILGDREDATVVAILGLHPTIGDLEAVSMRMAGIDDVLDGEPAPRSGIVAAIADMLAPDDEDEPSPSPR